MGKFKCALLIVMAFSAIGADDAAKTGKARVDIVGTASKINLTAGKTGDDVIVMPGPGLSSDAAKQAVAFQMPVTADAWKPMTFSFTPETDGKIQISLRGEFRKDTEVWVYYDAIEVTGATIANPDFEDTGSNNAPANWSVRPGQKPVVITDTAIVKSGKACIDVSHGNRLAQDFDVKAGTEVTITVQTRLDKVATK